MTRSKNTRTYIPKQVRYDLWVASAGRCAFCNVPLDRNILTQEKLFLGEHAHIIADTPGGPRGDAYLSAELAKDQTNIILLCSRCHKTVDYRNKDYNVPILRNKKTKHEKRINQIFNIGGNKQSLPVIFQHPIKKGHCPTITDKDIIPAILLNSEFEIFPHHDKVLLDYCSNAVREDDPTSWDDISKRMRDDLYSQIQSIERQANSSQIEHTSIFAFGPMPLLMQLGVYLGNKQPSSVFQWNRVSENWLFPQEKQQPPPKFTFDDLPPNTSGEIAVALSLSAEINLSAISAVTPNIPIVQFRVARPTTLLVESPDVIANFRYNLNQFLAEVRNSSYSIIHLFPAMPLSLAVELGRQLLPKADPAIKVWDFQESSKFIPTLILNFNLNGS